MYNKFQTKKLKTERDKKKKMKTNNDSGNLQLFFSIFIS